MGRAILVLSVIVLCSFTFVLVQLLRQRSNEPAGPPGPGQMLQVREDGSLYAVSVQLSRFEQRLMEAERRAIALQAEVDTQKQQREALETQVQELQDEIRRLRRQVSEKGESSTVPPNPTPPGDTGPEPAPAPGPPEGGGTP